MSEGRYSTPEESLRWDKNCEAIARIFGPERRAPVRSAADNRPLEDRVETLRYRYGINKLNRPRFIERVLSGESPEDVARDLSDWSRFRKRTRFDD